MMKLIEQICRVVQKPGGVQTGVVSFLSRVLINLKNAKC